MKPYHVYILILCLLSSCVIDIFIPVFTLRNETDRKIRIYYSNDKNIDTSFLNEKYAIILPHEIHSPLKGDIHTDKENYIADTSKKLYLFIFDNDTIDKLKSKENMEMIAEKSFLERRLINIREITSKDTLVYKNNSKQ